MTNELLIDFYLDYFNNYLTVETMAEHNNMTEALVESWINQGRELNEQLAKDK